MLFGHCEQQRDSWLAKHMVLASYTVKPAETGKHMFTGLRSRLAAKFEKPSAQ